jgi:hypothetical protein
MQHLGRAVEERRRMHHEHESIGRNRFQLFIRPRGHGPGHLGSCRKSSISSSWNAVIHRGTSRAFTSCVSSHPSSGCQRWCGNGDGSVGVVASGLNFIPRKTVRPKLWKRGSAASSDVVTESGIGRSDLTGYPLVAIRLWRGRWAAPKFAIGQMRLEMAHQLILMCQP